LSGKRTPLYDRHRAAGARIIDFGGWEMPVQYPTGIVKEHTAVRERVGIFDVSHMGEAFIRGRGALDTIQRLISNDAAKLGDGTALYTVMCYPHGGIVDDCIVYRVRADAWFIVLNAGNVAKDLAWIRDNLGPDAELDDQSEATALIAVQGPAAVELVAGLAATADAVRAVPRFGFADAEIAGVRCTAARTGYTGEDGFELACAAGDAAALWDRLAEAGCPPIGLGARDTLRLEARLCLYGNDIDETTNPYEAGLGWVVKPDAKQFIGRDALLAAKAAGLRRRLLGFRIEGKAGIARHGYPIVDRDAGEPVVGQVTSGAPGITVGGAIGLGYAPVAYDQPGRTITIDCRGKDVAATVVKGPFYKR